MAQKSVYDVLTGLVTIIDYDRACLIFEPTNLCTAILDIERGNTYTPPNEYYYILNDDGQVGWTWNGSGWNKPTDILIDAYLVGAPTADTPEVANESNRLATTFYVAEKIQDFIYNTWQQNGVLYGGSFGDAAPITLLNAGTFNDTNINLQSDIMAPVFNNTGGNLTSDITASTY